MYIMNQTRIEFTVPDEDDNGEGYKTRTHTPTTNHFLTQGTNGAKPAAPLLAKSIHGRFNVQAELPS
jgi:hypothetical protein